MSDETSFPAPTIPPARSHASTVQPPPLPRPLFRISGSRGLVAQHEVTWKTHVSSGGGGGTLYVNRGRGFGYVNPIWTRTSHTHRQDFWLRTREGGESSYWLEGFENVALRQGHEVGVLMANGAPAQLVNYTTQMSYRISTLNALIPQRTNIGFVNGAIMSLLVAPLATGIAYSALTSPTHKGDTKLLPPLGLGFQRLPRHALACLGARHRVIAVLEVAPHPPPPGQRGGVDPRLPGTHPSCTDLSRHGTDSLNAAESEIFLPEYFGWRPWDQRAFLDAHRNSSPFLPDVDAISLP